MKWNEDVLAHGARSGHAGDVNSTTEIGDVPAEDVAVAGGGGRRRARIVLIAVFALVVVIVAAVMVVVLSRPAEKKAAPPKGSEGTTPGIAMEAPEQTDPNHTLQVWNGTLHPTRGDVVIEGVSTVHRGPFPDVIASSASAPDSWQVQETVSLPKSEKLLEARLVDNASGDVIAKLRTGKPSGGTDVDVYELPAVDIKKLHDVSYTTFADGKRAKVVDIEITLDKPLDPNGSDSFFIGLHVVPDGDGYTLTY